MHDRHCGNVVKLSPNFAQLSRQRVAQRCVAPPSLDFHVIVSGRCSARSVKRQRIRPNAGECGPSIGRLLHQRSLTTMTIGRGSERTTSWWTVTGSCVQSFMKMSVKVSVLRVHACVADYACSRMYVCTCVRGAQTGTYEQSRRG